MDAIDPDKPHHARQISVGAHSENNSSHDNQDIDASWIQDFVSQKHSLNDFDNPILSPPSTMITSNDLTSERREISDSQPEPSTGTLVDQSNNVAKHAVSAGHFDMAHDAISGHFVDSRDFETVPIHTVGDNLGVQVLTGRLSEGQQTASGELAEHSQPGQLNFVSDGRTHHGKDGFPVDADLGPLGGSTHTVPPAVAQINNDQFIFSNADSSGKISTAHVFPTPDGGSEVVGTPGQHNLIDHVGDMHTGLIGDAFAFDFGPRGNGIITSFHQDQDVVNSSASGLTQPQVHAIIAAITPDENTLILLHTDTPTFEGVNVSPLNTLHNFILAHH
jgi:hypothetical protein